MTLPSYYDIIKSDLQRMASGDPSSQFLDFGGVNKTLSPSLILLSLQMRLMGTILGMEDWINPWCDQVERYALTNKGRAREDTLEALKLIYSVKGRESPISAAASSALGTKQQ